MKTWSLVSRHSHCYIVLHMEFYADFIRETMKVSNEMVDLEKIEGTMLLSLILEV